MGFKVQYVSEQGYLRDTPVKITIEGIRDIWIGEIEPLPEIKSEVNRYVRAIKQSGVLRAVGQSSGHVLEIHKPGYFNRFEIIDESQVADVCIWCGSPQRCKTDTGEWINHRYGWDCSNCGGS